MVTGQRVLREQQDGHGMISAISKISMISMIRDATQKNNGIFWEFFPKGGWWWVAQTKYRVTPVLRLGAGALMLNAWDWTVTIYKLIYY